jgi:hypothetical protein
MSENQKNFRRPEQRRWPVPRRSDEICLMDPALLKQDARNDPSAIVQAIYELILIILDE